MIRDIFSEGLWRNNTIFAQMLGLCPLLAVTTTAANGLMMGLATIMVLVGSNISVSLLRNYVPETVRIPSYILLIATFVTVVDLLMEAFLYDWHLVLGLFIPLIVVNCAILGRAEVYASKNAVGYAALDGLAMGVGFTLALTALGAVRELLGGGSVLGYTVTDGGALIFMLPPGAFIALAFLMAGWQAVKERQRRGADADQKEKV